MFTNYCSACKQDVVAEVNDANGFTCCTVCGKILDDSVFSTDPTFSKTSGGAIQVDGNFVPESGIAHSVGRPTRGGRVFGLQIDSHEKTVNKGKQEINQIADRLAMKPREDITTSAHRLYKIAVSRNFTRGRRTAQVAGACLYVVCRQENRPYMLIDFSDVLQTNVYVLGGVFLQLCRLMRLEQHPLMQRPIDPSLFIHRFADKMNLGKRVHTVASTALRLVASMKRDWMQTGRRPAGICGAALWVASHVHGFDRSKQDVVSIVHIGEQTLKKRITEFSSTPAALLSVEEFDAQAAKYEDDDFIGSKEQQDLIGSCSTSLICKHKDDDNAPEVFQHGMCRACYIDYVKVTGGTTFIGGMDPPAFIAAQKKRAEELSATMLRIADFAAGGEVAAVRAEFEGALLGEGGINEFALIAGVVSGPPVAAAIDAPAAPVVAEEPVVPQAERRPPQVLRQVQVQRVILKEPHWEFQIEAERSLKRLVGNKWSEMFCLPFVHGKSKGCVSKEHFKIDIVENNDFVKEIRLEIMHYLINLGCFDEEALDFLDTFYPGHDLIMLGDTDFDPPEQPKKLTLAEEQVEKKKEREAGKILVNSAEESKNEDANNNANNNNNNNNNNAKQQGAKGSAEDVPTAAADEVDEIRDTLSDIEEDDVLDYINNPEQVKLKRLIWSEMNKDYLQTQAAKEAASKAAARDPNLLPKKKYNTKKKDEKYLKADNASTAVQEVLVKKKGPSSKLNYEALQNLFNEGDQKKDKAGGGSAPAKKAASKSKTTTTTAAQKAPSAAKTTKVTFAGDDAPAAAVKKDTVAEKRKRAESTKEPKKPTTDKSATAAAAVKNAARLPSAKKQKKTKEETTAAAAPAAAVPRVQRKTRAAE